MEVGAYEIALIGVVGALLCALIAYRFSLKLADINARREVNQRLIATFHRELADIYPTPVNWPKNIDNFLRSKFSILQAVVGEFRHSYQLKNGRLLTGHGLTIIVPQVERLTSSAKAIFII